MQDQHCSYNRLMTAESSNTSDDSRHLLVNCAGRCVMPQYFCTNQPEGRRDHYMMYLTHGLLKISSGTHDADEPTFLCPGQLFLYPPHVAYRYESADDQEVRYYWIHFTGYGAAGLLSECSIPVGAVRTVGFPDGIEDCYRALFRCFITRTPCSDTAAAAKLTEICARFGDAMQTESENPEREHLPVRQIYTSLSYLHENLSLPLTVEELAAMEHLGVSRYRSLFRTLTGLSPVAYITGQRIARACELLSQTSLPMQDIASAVGYADPLYFSRVFRAQTGETPSAYRKKRR